MSGGKLTDQPIARLALALEPRLQSLERLLGALQGLECYAHADAPTREAARAAQSRLALAAGEALVNIVRHAAPRRAVQVVVQAYDDRISVELRDDGPAFDMFAAPAGLPEDPFAEAGRGLFLIRESVDERAYRRVGNENVHTMTVRLGKEDRPG